MTLLEAMTLDVPVLSRNLPTIKKVLCDGDCGIFAESDSVDDYARVILSVIKDKSSLRLKVRQAKNEVIEKYNIDWVFTILHVIFTHVIVAFL